MKTVTYNGVEYAPIDLPKVGEKVLVPDRRGNYLEVVVEHTLSSCIMSDDQMWDYDKVLRRVNPQPQANCQPEPQPQAPAPLTAEQQVWLTVYAAAVRGGYGKGDCEDQANEAQLLFNQRFNPQP